MLITGSWTGMKWNGAGKVREHLRATATMVLGSQWNGLRFWGPLVIGLMALGATLDAKAVSPQVASRLQAAKKQFEPIRPEELAAARKEVRVAADTLWSFLTEHGSEEDARLWWEYLRLEGALAELDKEKPSLRQLGASAAMFYRHEDGLHLEVFTRLRDALTKYVNLLALAAHPNLRQEYLRQLESLEKALADLDKDPTDVGAAERVGRALGFLDRMGRQRRLVVAVRRHYFHPNLVARVSAKMVAEGIDEPVAEPIELADNIMGTTIYGSGQIKAQVSSSLVPARKQIRVRLSLDGEATTENVGYNRSVKIWSTGWTSLRARKDVLIRPTGIETSWTDAEAATSTNVYALSAPNCLVEKIAWKRVGKTKGQAEVIAAQRAAGRLADDMDARVDELLARPRERFETQFRQPLLRRAAWPAVFDLSSTEKEIRVRLMQAQVAEAAAATPAPPLDAQQDIGVRVHETLVSNLSRALIGGVTLTDERLVEILKNADVEIPEELRITPDKPSWSIRFASRKPVSAVFRDGKIQIAILGQRFQQGDTVTTRPIKLSATYTIEWKEGSVRLVRQGNVSVDFVGLKQLGAEEIALRQVMRRKFEALFKPEFQSKKDLKLPGRWSDAGTLRIVRLDPSDGWLSLDWVLQSPQADEAQRDVAVAGR